jgi:hypothetical protein
LRQHIAYRGEPRRPALSREITNRHSFSSPTIVAELIDLAPFSRGLTAMPLIGLGWLRLRKDVPSVPQTPITPAFTVASRDGDQRGFVSRPGKKRTQLALPPASIATGECCRGVHVVIVLSTDVSELAR